MKKEQLKETMSLAGVLAGAGVLGGSMALGIAWMLQAWLMEFLRLQVTIAGMARL